MSLRYDARRGLRIGQLPRLGTGLGTGLGTYFPKPASTGAGARDPLGISDCVLATPSSAPTAKASITVPSMKRVQAMLPYRHPGGVALNTKRPAGTWRAFCGDVTSCRWDVWDEIPAGRDISETV